MLAVDDRVDYDISVRQRRHEDAVFRGRAGDVSAGDEDRRAEDLGKAGGLVLEAVAGRHVPMCG